MLSGEWLKTFANVAIAISGKSKDQSTKVGAVLIRPDKSIASVGFNGYPPRIPDNPDHCREDKLCRTIHAEKNALKFSRDNTTENYSMLVTHHPCEPCARDLANTNISTVYYLEGYDVSFDERWKDSREKAQMIFAEAGIQIIPYTYEG